MYFLEFKIPDEVKVEVEGNKFKVSGPLGNLEKTFKIPKEIKVEKIDNTIKVSCEEEKRKLKAMVGTLIAHLRNMVEGVQKGFKYKLKIVYSHFPVTVKVEGDKVLIQNFLGERVPRVAKIKGNVKVEVVPPEIYVSGIDLEDVSQTAANIEQACRIKARDRRIFQDGIWIVGRE
ncbi:MAG: 50S ribosomal protein L6 [Candidatus Aenigmatarchaeota archaeon]